MRQRISDACVLMIFTMLSNIRNALLIQINKYLCTYVYMLYICIVHLYFILDLLCTLFHLYLHILHSLYLYYIKKIKEYTGCSALIRTG